MSKKMITYILVFSMILLAISSTSYATENPLLSNEAHTKSTCSEQNREGTLIRYLKLRVMLDNSYRSNYDNPYATAANTLTYVDYPFASIWGIRFTKSYVDIAPLPIDSCFLAYSTLCNNSCCGNNSNVECNNNTYNLIHHKNASKNLNKIKSTVSSSGYDIMLTMVSAALCGVFNGQHYYGGVLGVAYVNGKYALVHSASTVSEIIKVRTVQHEISHLFGCLDGMCASGEKCIMSGGFDTIYPNSYNNIWCSNCSARFNPNSH